MALLEHGHRSPGSSAGQLVEQVTVAERPRRQGGRHRRGEERAGQRHPAHLLQDDAHLEEPGPFVGDQHGRPPERYQLFPQLRRIPGVVVGQLPEKSVVEPVHGSAGHILKGQLFGIECEVHGPPRDRQGWVTARA